MTSIPFEPERAQTQYPGIELDVGCGAMRTEEYSFRSRLGKRQPDASSSVHGQPCYRPTIVGGHLQIQNTCPGAWSGLQIDDQGRRAFLGPFENKLCAAERPPKAFA